VDEIEVVDYVSEEIGLQVTSTSYLLSHPNQYDYRGVIADVIDYFYLVDVATREGIELAEDEVEHFEWARPTSAHLENMAFHSNRLAIEHWMKSQSN
ncbi:MAG: NUDIX domain-containing protein, partial [Planctomycetota bacterium]